MKKQFSNQFINFTWTILCFLPVIFFWFPEGIGSWFYIFLLASFLPVLMPSRLFQLSSNPRYYEKLGVRWIKKFVQNGDMVNRSFKNESDKTIKNKNHAGKYLKTILMYEKYHVICFVFFGLSAIYAIYEQEMAYFILIVISNVIYNICPVILQQYNERELSD